MTSYHQQIQRLKVKHQELHERIERLDRKQFEDVALPKLKREKLAIKDEISRLERVQWEQQHDTLDWDDER